MPKNKNTTIFPEQLTLYEKLVATRAGVELKGATMPYTACNGHMFSFLDKEVNLGLRLPVKVRENFISKYKTRLCEQHGIVLKEYVLVPEKLFKNTEELKEFFATSLEYVRSLKPKATKK